MSRGIWEINTMSKQKGSNEKGKPTTFVRESSGLVREMGVTDIMAFIMAPVMGGGVAYYICTIAGASPGASIPLVFLIMGLLYLPYVATMGILSSTMPRSGGMFVPISRTLHPALGFASGWLAYVGMGMIVGIICSVGATLLGVAFLITGVWTSVGTWLTSHVLWVGILFAVGGWAVQLSGIKVLRYITKAGVYIPFAVLVIVWGILSVTGPEGAMEAFNAEFGAGAWGSLLEAAGNAGWEFPAITLGATGSALIAAVWSLQGSISISFFGGEIKTMGKKITYSYIGGYLLAIAGYVGTAALLYWCFGGIIGPQGFLATHSPGALAEVLGAPIKPSLPFYMGLLLPTGTAFAVVMLITMWPLNGILPIFASTSRVLFALSFDRAVPSEFAEVNDRGAPTWATHITLGMAIAGCIVFHFGVKEVLGTTAIPFTFMIMMFGMSAMILPFIRPSLFDRAPIKSKSLMVLLGAYTMVFGFFTLFLCALEMGISSALYISILLGVGMIIYTYQQKKNVESGVDISKVYEEIPPG